MENKTITPLPLAIRAHLFRHFFQVDTERTLKSTRFTVQDVAFIPRVGLRESMRFFRDFRTYAGNFVIDDRGGIASFYSRAGSYLFYCLFFSWTDICNIRDEVVQQPDRSFIAELFIRYIFEIDQLIDSAEAELSPVVIKQNWQVKSALSRLIRLVRDRQIIALPSSAQNEVFREIAGYRRQSLHVYQSSARSNSQNLVSVLREKDSTVGGLLRTWARILCILYGNRQPIRFCEESQTVMGHAGMAVQVTDDIMDFPLDLRTDTNNIFHEILKEHPEELNMAKRYAAEYTSWNHLDAIWAEQYLPLTFQRAVTLLQRYVSKIESSDPTDGEATSLIRRALTQSLDHPVGV